MSYLHSLPPSLPQPLLCTVPERPSLSLRPPPSKMETEGFDEEFGVSAIEKVEFELTVGESGGKRGNATPMWGKRRRRRDS